MVAELVVIDLDTPTPPGPGDPPSTVTPCPRTLADVIARTRQLILTGRREERNRLTTTVNPAAESLTFDFPKGSIGPNARLGIDLELFHVYDADGNTATVEPGDQGTTSVAHQAGATIRVNPRVSDFDIFNAINETLDELSSPGSGLFRVATLDLANDPNASGYDLDGATDLYDIIDVWYQTTTTDQWRSVNAKYWRLQRNADVTVFPSGYGLTFLRGFGAAEGATIRVAYKTAYLPLAAVTDNVRDVSGLHCQAHDLLSVGAAIRLTDSREIERNQTMSQAEPRRASEVPAGAVMQSYSGLQRRWTQRIRSEAARLAREVPSYYR